MSSKPNTTKPRTDFDLNLGYLLVTDLTVQKAGDYISIVDFNKLVEVDDQSCLRSSRIQLGEPLEADMHHSAVMAAVRVVSELKAGQLDVIYLGGFNIQYTDILGHEIPPGTGALQWAHGDLDRLIEILKSKLN